VEVRAHMVLYHILFRIVEAAVGIAPILL
jgi:hypothetical protein